MERRGSCISISSFSALSLDKPCINLSVTSSISSSLPFPFSPFFLRKNDSSCNCVTLAVAFFSASARFCCTYSAKFNASIESNSFSSVSNSASSIMSRTIVFSSAKPSCCILSAISATIFCSYCSKLSCAFCSASCFISLAFCSSMMRSIMHTADVRSSSISPSSSSSSSSTGQSIGLVVGVPLPSGCSARSFALASSFNFSNFWSITASSSGSN
mmetsp:Transcript_55672/g.82830  ORF Transcript_55672/g.82830 Transcript_55672/m.82830 type:complete len:215 (-) Transcript_55672:858-1502(-)